VNARFMMVRLNKTKPEGYMWSLDVPGGYPMPYTAQESQVPGSNPGGGANRFIFIRASGLPAVSTSWDFMLWLASRAGIRCKGF